MNDVLIVLGFLMTNIAFFTLGWSIGKTQRLKSPAREQQK